jgi:hypothetical protein
VTLRNRNPSRNHLVGWVCRSIIAKSAVATSAAAIPPGMHDHQLATDNILRVGLNYSFSS